MMCQKPQNPTKGLKPGLELGSVGVCSPDLYIILAPQLVSSMKHSLCERRPHFRGGGPVPATIS